jgi:hypothetical protein
MSNYNTKNKLVKLLQEYTDNNNGGGSNHGRADYLIENGIVVPPCKIGDTVYEFFDVRGFYNITEYIVKNIVISMNPQKTVICCKSIIGNSTYEFSEDSFGKTLFFNKEDAEKTMNIKMHS